MLNIKIQTIGMIIAVLLAVATAGVVFNSILTVKQVTMLGNTWEKFEEGPAKKTDYIKALYRAIGFGGMIHKYKDFILESKREQLIEFNAKVREAAVALSDYGRVGVNEQEKEALHAIQGVLKNYVEASQQVEKLSTGGMSSAQIVTKVMIDDAPAMKGIETLSAEISKSRNESATAVYQAVSEVTTFVQTMTVVVGLILATMVISLFWFTRYRLGRPMQNMTQAMKKLADDDLSVEVPARDRKDEIGEMAQTVQVFKENALEMRRMESEQAEMRERSEKEKRDMMNKLADDLENNVGAVMNDLFEGASDIVATAEKLGSKMDTSSSRSLDVAGASGRTSTNVHTLASATEQLSTSINEISQQVAQSSKITSSAVNQAQNTNEQVQGLAFAAEKVGEVVDLIADIAEQTNLLALNATIEAARAGEAGKGFAVVASEVKNLANQTARATEEISGQIGDIQSATKDSVDAIQGIVKTIGDVNEIAAAIAAAVEEQGAATQEIARNVRDVTDDAQTVSDSIVDVTRGTAASYGSAIQVLWRAKDLSKPAKALDNEIDTFLSSIRSTA